MPIDPAWLQQSIAARRFEDVGRRLPEASEADLAVIPTPDLLEYLESLSDTARRTGADGVWRALRRRRPTDGDLARQLAGQLILAGFATDAGLAIDATLEAVQDKASAVWKWIIYLISLDATAEARAQLTGYSGYFEPDTLACAAAQIDLGEGKYDAAVTRLEPIVHRNPSWHGIQAAIDRARTCSSVAARFAAAGQAPDEPPDYAVFAINLDEHAERLARLRRRFPVEPPVLLRIPGVKGRYLPDVAAQRLADPRAAVRKGTLGCFLAHVAAWERFRASVFDHGLFVEDDARVAFDLPPTLAAFDLPSDYDLCFAGYGMEPQRPPVPTGFLHLAPVAATLAAKDPTWNAPGAYGYFLSRRGVETLLDLVARDGFAGDVDWRLIAYSIGRTDYEGLSPESFASTTLGRLLACIGARPSIAGYCLYPALCLPGRAGSTRMADNIVR